MNSHGFVWAVVPALTIGALAISTSTALAQQGQGRQQQNQRQNQQQNRPQQLSPDDMEVVGIDLDGDGRVDTLYYITRYDFDQASNKAFQEHPEGLSGQWNPMTQQSRFGSESQWQPQQRSRFNQPQGMGEGGGGMNRQGQQMAFQQPQQQFQGTVQGLKTTTPVGENQPHLLAKLDLDNGRAVVADLGPRAEISQADISKGDQLTVLGHQARLNDRTIIIAEQVETDQGTFDIPQGRQASLARVEGTVVGTTSFSPNGSGPSHNFARVRTDNGRTLLVDLGTRQDITVDKGEQISAVGFRTLVNNQPALKAARVRTEDQTYRINSAMQGGQSGMMNDQSGMSQPGMMNGQSRTSAQWGSSEW